MTFSQIFHINKNIKVTTSVRKLLLLKPGRSRGLFSKTYPTSSSDLEGLPDSWGGKLEKKEELVQGSQHAVENQQLR